LSSRASAAQQFEARDGSGEESAHFQLSSDLSGGGILSGQKIDQDVSVGD
jgi:hypothetical protein